MLSEHNPFCQMLGVNVKTSKVRCLEGNTKFTDATDANLNERALPQPERSLMEMTLSPRSLEPSGYE